jgi:hypothetical protein
VYINFNYPVSQIHLNPRMSVSVVMVVFSYHRRGSKAFISPTCDYATSVPLHRHTICSETLHLIYAYNSKLKNLDLPCLKLTTRRIKEGVLEPDGQEYKTHANIRESISFGATQLDSFF